MPVIDDIAGLARILTQSRVIAVVGLSPNWYRPSYFAAKYMQEHGYHAVPVNPNASEILGETCYPSVAAIPGAVDIVDCFRQPEEMPDLARARPWRRAPRCCGCSSGSGMRKRPGIAADAGLEVV